MSVQRATLQAGRRFLRQSDGQCWAVLWQQIDFLMKKAATGVNARGRFCLSVNGASHHMFG